jgi:hypothetical protein
MGRKIILVDLHKFWHKSPEPFDRGEIKRKKEKRHFTLLQNLCGSPTVKTKMTFNFKLQRSTQIL